MRYWVYRDSRIAGPYAREELSSVEGLSGESLVCPESAGGINDSDWVPLSSVQELGALGPSPVAVAVADPAWPPLEADSPYAPAGPWDAPDPEYSSDARVEAERLRSRELEERVLSLREEVAGFESRQDQLLERLSQKERDLASRDRAIEELAARLERLEARAGSASPSAAPPPAQMPSSAPAPVPAPAPAEPVFLREPLLPPEPARREPPAAARQEPAPVRREEPPPTAFAAAPRAFTVDELLKAPPPAESPMGFEYPRATPLKAADALPAGGEFIPPAPGDPPTFITGRSHGPEESMTHAVNDLPAQPAQAAAAGPVPIELTVAAKPAPLDIPAGSPPPLEIRVLVPEPVPGAIQPPEFAAPVPSPAAEMPAPAPAPIAIEPAAFTVLGPDAPPPVASGNETPPAEPAPVERLERPRTMVLGGAPSAASGEAAAEALVSLSPFTPPPALPRNATPLPFTAPPADFPAGQPALPSAVIPRRNTTRPPASLAAPARQAFEPSQPGASPARPAGRQKAFLAAVGGAGLCLVGLLFLFLRNPKQVQQMVSMDPSDKGKAAPAVAASAEVPAAEPPAQPAAAPMPAPEPAPAPAPSRDYIEDHRIKALEFVKEYPLGQDKGTIERQLQFSFSSPEVEEQWSAGALSANVYHVSYRVVRKGQAGRDPKPIARYGFEADLAAGTITGTTPEARDLLAASGIGSSGEKPAAAPRKPAPARSRPAKPRRRAAAPGQLPLPEDGDPLSGGAGGGFNNPGANSDAAYR